MPSNGKSNGHTHSDPDLDDALMDGSEEKYTLPLIPSDAIKFSRTGKGYAYYCSLKGKWQSWWDEFTTAQDKNGNLLYHTVLHFIKKKTKSQWQRDVLYQIIGPYQAIEDGEKREVPWLGDWQERRSQGFWAFNKPSKFRHLERAYRDNVQRVEAARGVCPLIIKHISRMETLGTQIDEAFNGRPFLPGEPPNSPRNRQRVRHYIRLHKAVLQVSVALWKEWYKANGLHPDDPSSWLAIRMADIPMNGLLPVNGQVIEGQIADPNQALVIPGAPGVTLDDLMMAKALRAKAKMFRMGMPADLNAMVEPITQEEINEAVKTKNGKKVH